MLNSTLPVCEMLPLDRLRTGESAEVVTVCGGIEQVHRLHELGFKQGAELSVIQAGTPCIIRIAGQSLCFRSDDSLRVLVRPTAHA